MLREVRLYGKLGAEFGRRFLFDVDSVGEAIRALIANFPAFEQRLQESKNRYAVFIGKLNVGPGDELTIPHRNTEPIRIAPWARGAEKSPWVQIVVGAVLLVASIVFPVLAPIGITLITSGVAQLLYRHTLDDMYREKPENKPSYIFNGPVNTTQQGNAVPVGYGELIIGSCVISMGITAEEFAV